MFHADVVLRMRCFWGDGKWFYGDALLSPLQLVEGPNGISQLRVSVVKLSQMLLQLGVLFFGRPKRNG